MASSFMKSCSYGELCSHLELVYCGFGVLICWKIKFDNYRIWNLCVFMIVYAFFPLLISHISHTKCPPPTHTQWKVYIFWEGQMFCWLLWKVCWGFKFCCQIGACITRESKIIIVCGVTPCCCKMLDYRYLWN